MCMLCVVWVCVNVLCECVWMCVVWVCVNVWVFCAQMLPLVVTLTLHSPVHWRVLTQFVLLLGANGWRAQLGTTCWACVRIPVSCDWCQRLALAGGRIIISVHWVSGLNSCQVREICKYFFAYFSFSQRLVRPSPSIYTILARNHRNSTFYHSL